MKTRETSQIFLNYNSKIISIFILAMLLTLSCKKTPIDPPPPLTVSTIAGSTQGYTDDVGSSAQFHYPTGVAVDASGNIYVADVDNNKIRKITTDGVVTTLAGSTQGFADGAGANAKFNHPVSLTVDSAGNVYVADVYNHRVRKIAPDGVVTTLAGSVAGFENGLAADAKFNQVNGVAVDASGNVYVSDKGNRKVRKITSTGVVTTLAGSIAGYADGAGVNAQFNLLRGITVDASGNVYVADDTNQKIRKITPSGVVSTVAGSVVGFLDGSSDQAQFNVPIDIAVDASGVIYVADYNNSRIRKIATDGTVSTLAGSTAGYVDGEGSAEDIHFNHPYGVAIDNSGNIIVADAANNRIRKIIQN